MTRSRRPHRPARARRWLREEWAYTWMGPGLGLRVAADLRSAAWLSVLGSPIVARRRRRPARVRIRLRGRVFAVGICGRTELHVLHEIAIADEYGGTDHLPAATIVDLGAHIGLATLRLLAAHPAARVVAVEADPVLVERLRANVDGLGVTVVHAAIGSRPGRRTFYRSDAAGWSNSLTRALPSQEEVTVPAITFPDLLDRCALDAVDLLKIDIEGGEWEVLGDGVPECVGSILAEFHAHEGRAPRELMASTAGGMDVRVLREGEEQVVFSATRVDRGSREARGG